jgi:hypothetical protein
MNPPTYLKPEVRIKWDLEPSVGFTKISALNALNGDCDASNPSESKRDKTKCSPAAPIKL